MKLNNKRYIYSAILSVVVFIILYLVLNFELYISIPITILMYIGGSLFFKDKDVREYDPEVISKYFFQVSKLANSVSRVTNDDIKDDCLEITEIAKKILEALQQKPKKVTQVYNFFDYYIPLTTNLIDKYLAIEHREEKSKTEENFIKNAEKYLINIKKEANKQLDNMYRTKQLDMELEIKLFEKMCDFEDLDEVEEKK